VKIVEIGQQYCMIGLPNYETLNGVITVSLEVNNVIPRSIGTIGQRELSGRIRLLHEGRVDRLLDYHLS
jgi:hypothetical protein